MKKRPVACAILAALCYGISTPLSKLLLTELPPMLMAALLYCGAGLGMLLLNLLRKKSPEVKEAPLTRKELPYAFAMIMLDIAAPILLMLGLASASPAAASLLNNFEIVATSVIALAFFKEAVGKRMWLAIILITVASILLSADDFTALSFSPSAIFILLAGLCWGIENNCTRMLSLKDPLQIVVLKGFGSGLGSLLLSLTLGERAGNIRYAVAALLLGFVAYGLSIYFYILAQRDLGASRTSAYYAFAPFIGVSLSLLIFTERPPALFFVALAIMAAGTFLAAYEKHSHLHIHQAQMHEHRHNHSDGHHNHSHAYPLQGEHSHPHTHEALSHRHHHTPDLHHTHSH